MREVVSSNPGAVYWIDLTFFTFICCKNCNVCLKRPKINEKEAGVCPFFKKGSVKQSLCATSVGKVFE